MYVYIRESPRRVSGYSELRSKALPFKSLMNHAAAAWYEGANVYAGRWGSGLIARVRLIDKCPRRRITGPKKVEGGNRANGLCVEENRKRIKGIRTTTKVVNALHSSLYILVPRVQ